MNRFLFILVFSSLAACATDPGRGIPAPVEEQSAPADPSVSGSAATPGRRDVPPQTVPVPEPEPAPPSPPSPVASLLASADAAMLAGDLEQAAALCERALRISPRDGQVWYRLASIRLEQERYAEAQGLARRALSFAGDDRTLTRRANDVIERANRATGTR